MPRKTHARRAKQDSLTPNGDSPFQAEPEHVLKFDIARYFDSIDHSLLFGEFARRIRDEEVLQLLRLVIGTQGDDQLLWPSGRGIPIGNLTSQFFANVYLNPFDHWIKEEIQGRHYIRYVDDMVLFDNDKCRLHDLIPRIRGQLETLNLRLHPRKCNVYPVIEGSDFMGYRIWPGHRRIRPKNGYRQRRTLKKLVRQYSNGCTDLGHIQSCVVSWIGHASHADTWALRGALLREIVFVRHWNHREHRAQHDCA